MCENTKKFATSDSTLDPVILFIIIGKVRQYIIFFLSLRIPDKIQHIANICAQEEKKDKRYNKFILEQLYIQALSYL